jgi:predicted Rossmann fold nucleotide-binding protein DprA/Smf involved in DNA uptake
MSIINNDTMTILLLTSHLGSMSRNDMQPLGAMEWNRLALWLKEKNVHPADLLTGNPSDLLHGWNEKRCPQERLMGLLNRGVLLGVALEKWERAGLWVLIHTDADYPEKLKERLKESAPPVFFGCGNRRLLNASGVAVVGSRNASPEDLAFSAAFGKKLALSGKAVISGGARGVDESAMTGAIAVEGTVVGVLADSLLKASVSQKYRSAIQRKNVVLISPYYPEAPFNVGNAMARNKFIYCLADSAVVVHSGREGGTWNGAIENLKKGWVPLWVKQTSDKKAGNLELVNRGAQWLSDESTERTLPMSHEHIFGEEDSSRRISTVSTMEPHQTYGTIGKEAVISDKTKETVSQDVAYLDQSLYELFCRKLSRLLDKGGMQHKDIENGLGLTTAQVKIWIEQAVEDGLIKKRSKPVRPVRYELAAGKRKDEQGILF